MKRPFRALLGLVIAVAVAACTTTQGGQATTSSPTPIPTSTSGSATTIEDRAFDGTGCESPPASVAIVCETYELIADNYVDEVSDADLADAANDRLATITADGSDEQLICATPTSDFETPCSTAAGLGLDSEKTAEAMVDAMVSGTLDPNSAYFDPEALALLDQEDEGEIEGIGALVSPEDPTLPGDNKQCSLISETCRILVVSTIEGAPAGEAGLTRDDVMVAVDGEPIIGMTVDEVTSLVRGPAGTPVTLTIERAGETFDVTMVRAAVRIPVLESERIGDTGYIRLYVFSESADEEFEEAVVDLLADGAERLVIDLRDNPGGLLDTAIEVASVFLEDGEVVVTQGPDDRTSYPVTGAAVVPRDIEVDFVVNKGSASASEVVSAVLQERGRATVVGESTFGKNTVQQRFALSNGGALKLTIARWLTPSGHDFGGTGVSPDVNLFLGSDLEAAAVVAAVLAAT